MFEVTDSLKDLAFLGTFVCAFGFLRWPRSLYDLLRPRFVIPALIWSSTFNVIFYHWIFPQPEKYIDYRTYIGSQGETALIYFIVCMLMFWVGMCLPFGKMIGRMFVPLHYGLPLDPKKLRILRVFGIFLGVGIFVSLIAMSGGTALYSPVLGIDHRAGYLRGGISGPLVGALSILASGCIGVSWPEKVRDNPLAVIVSLFGLMLIGTHFMANFSRGSGLPIAVAALAYAVRYRRVSLIGMGLAICWVLFTAHAGLSGRGIYGHRGGVVPYLIHLVTYSSLSGFQVIESSFIASDAFTATAVTMEAHDAMDIGAMSPWDWLRFQIPIPRIFGIHPDWHVAVSFFLSGSRNQGFGFTTSIFGDTFIHLGWPGSAIYIFIGIMYRMVSFLAFDLSDKISSKLNPFILLMATSYYAMFLGIFNNFRSWNTTFSYSLYLMIIGMIILRSVFPSVNSNRAAIPA